MSHFGDTLKMMYYAQGEGGLPRRGLLYYDTLTHLADGLPDYSTIEVRRTGTTYPGIAQQTVAGVPCATITSSVDEGRLYTLVWQNGSATGRSQSVLFHLGSEPTASLTTKPVGYLQRIELTNGHLCNVLANLYYSEISLYDNNTGSRLWSQTFTRPTTNAWHLMVLTFSATSHTVELWLDNTRVVSYTDSSMAWLGDDAYYILGYDMPRLDSLAHACLYDHALTSNEVGRLYEALMPQI